MCNLTGAYTHKQKEDRPRLDAYIHTGTGREHAHDQERERKMSEATFKKNGRGKKDKGISHI